MSPSISVVTVTLNAASVLPALIESFRGQTDQASTFAVFDGGSRDNSAELVRNTKLPPRERDQRVSVAAIGKMERLKGWKPQLSTKDGVSKMLAWTSSKLASLQ